MEAHWKEAVIDSERGLVLKELPFQPGETVDVLIISKAPRRDLP
jgi:hypothetical protein